METDMGSVGYLKSLMRRYLEGAFTLDEFRMLMVAPVRDSHRYGEQFEILAGSISYLEAQLGLGLATLEEFRAGIQVLLDTEKYVCLEE